LFSGWWQQLAVTVIDLELPVGDADVDEGVAVGEPDLQLLPGGRGAAAVRPESASSGRMISAVAR
jgi:hypothetical protein